MEDLSGKAQNKAKLQEVEAPVRADVPLVELFLV